MYHRGVNTRRGAMEHMCFGGQGPAGTAKKLTVKVTFGTNSRK